MSEKFKMSSIPASEVSEKVEEEQLEEQEDSIEEIAVELGLDLDSQSIKRLENLSEGNGFNVENVEPEELEELARKINEFTSIALIHGVPFGTYIGAKVLLHSLGGPEEIDTALNTLIVAAFGTLLLKGKFESIGDPNSQPRKIDKFLAEKFLKSSERLQQAKIKAKDFFSQDNNSAEEESL